jgi:hypothetical protein
MIIALATEGGIVRSEGKDFPLSEESWKIYIYIYIHYFSL